MAVKIGQPLSDKELAQRLRIKVRSDIDALEALLQDATPAQRQDVLWQRGIVKLQK